MAVRAIIEGYAAIFGVRDLNGDIIRPRAFSQKLIPARSDAVRMLYQHDVAEPIGRWHLLREDRRGLFVRGEILPETRRGKDVWALVRRGALDGLSIGFRTQQARRTRSGRELTAIDLWEISIVTFPMAPGARITSARLAGDRENRPGSIATAATAGQQITDVARQLRVAAGT